MKSGIVSLVLIVAGNSPQGSQLIGDDVLNIRGPSLNDGVEQLLIESDMEQSVHVLSLTLLLDHDVVFGRIQLGEPFSIALVTPQDFFLRVPRVLLQQQRIEEGLSISESSKGTPCQLSLPVSVTHNSWLGLATPLETRM